MPTETEPATATSQKTNEGHESSQRTALTQQSRPGAIARNLRPGVLGLPLSPFDMFRMTPFSLFRRMADELDRALQPLASEGEIKQAIAWTPIVEISERAPKPSYPHRASTSSSQPRPLLQWQSRPRRLP